MKMNASEPLKKDVYKRQRQALGKPLPDLESFKQQVRTWTIRRNAECAKINWQFKTQDARIKLARLYPVIV